MGWLRTGDNATSHPRLLEAAVHEDKMTVWGLLCALAVHSAAHETDYRFTFAVALHEMSGDRARTTRLLRVMTKTGLVTKAGAGEFRLIDDPDLFGIRLKAEVEWERQQGRDTSNPAITMPVRVRDGDACRYCGAPVNFGVRRGGRRGTYDHTEPGKAGTVETIVVACGQCNPGKRDGADGRAERYRLLPAPPRPWYRPETITWLAEAGYRVDSAPDIPARVSPASSDEARPEDPAHRVAGHDDARPATDEARPEDPAPLPKAARATRGSRAPVADSAHRDPQHDDARPPDPVPPSSSASAKRAPRKPAAAAPPPVSAETSPGNLGNPGRASTGRTGPERARAGSSGPGVSPPAGAALSKSRRGSRAPRARGGPHV